MAIAIIGGLLVSTLLSLLFVPAFFTIMDDVGRLFSRLFGRLVGRSDDAPTKPLTAPPMDAAPQEVGKPAH
jgi:hypothetical protein